MRYIRKGVEPETLSSWKAEANADWHPTWDGLQKPQKPALHRALLVEQGYVCCYCEARIDETESHIEHLRARSRREDLELEYTNLLASCHGETENPPPKLRHCGDKKKGWYEEVLEERFVSPLDPQCVQMFRYAGNGQIMPAKDPVIAVKASFTIKLLSLDIPKLDRARKGAIDGALFGLEDLSDEEIRKLVNGFGKRDEDNRYKPFVTSIIYVLSQLLG